MTTRDGTGHPDDLPADSLGASSQVTAPSVTDEGGDPACWLPLVCPQCGRLAGPPLPTTCSRCGTQVRAVDD